MPTYTYQGELGIGDEFWTVNGSAKPRRDVVSSITFTRGEWLINYNPVEWCFKTEEECEKESQRRIREAIERIKQSKE